MRYATVCSGIEAPSVAWHPLGWKPAFFSEIEAFPCAVLANHYPDVPNHGDMTRFKEWPDATFDVLCGGTPCQSFSVAGLRKGLADPRGNLTLTFLAIAARYRPTWLVWENVPGVLSDATGAFGAFLGGLAELGYGWAYRVLDAQYAGVPQRRRRVFVVGHSRDWRLAAAVLFERHSLSGHPAPRREAGQRAAESAARSVAIRGREGVPQAELGDDKANAILTPNGGRGGIGVGAVMAPTHYQDSEFGCREYDTAANEQTYVAFSAKDHGADASDIAPTLRAGGHTNSHANAGVMPAVAFCNTAGDTALGMSKPGVPPLTSRHGDPGNVLLGMQVRRLTPRECERLQGFPDDYTQVPYRGKPAADGPRYKALGNSMAVPVVRWLGERIQMVSELEAA